MPLPIGPVWSLLHLGIKYPALTVVCTASVLTLSNNMTSPLYANDQALDRVVPESGPMIALTFDDGWRSVYDIALPEMYDRGMVGTNYVHTQYIGEGTPNYITPTQLQEFVAAGWEVGSHSHYHIDLTTVELGELEYTMELASAQLTDWTGLGNFSFSSPMGMFDQTVVRTAETFYSSHVNAWSDEDGVNTLDNFDLFNIHRLDTQNTDIAGVCDTVASLGSDDFYVVIFHKIDESGDDYSLTPRDFGTILDCVGASDAQVVTVSDGAESMIRRLE